jgi:hypothetical protein
MNLGLRQLPSALPRGDVQAAVHVETVGVGAVDPDAGVEVELIAAESFRLREQPVEQAAGQAAAPGPRQSMASKAEPVSGGRISRITAAS